MFPESQRPLNPILGLATLLAALLRELVKEMPADKRLSFQTRVANARTKEAVESVLQDYAQRLECLVLPHARSGEIDLQQVKKVCVSTEEFILSCRGFQGMGEGGVRGDGREEKVGKKK